MSSVYFDPAVGGDGSTVSDDSNPITGLANGGHRARFVPSLAQSVAVAANTVTKAQEALASANAAAASAATAVNSPGTSATSTSSLTVGTGSKTLTVQTGKMFVVGQPVMIARTSAPGTTWMAGNITAYNSGTGVMTISAAAFVGSGTYADWTVSLSAPILAGIPDDVVIASSNTAAALFKTYVITSEITVTLPAAPAVNGWLVLINRSGSSNVVIANNSNPIMGLSENMQLNALARCRLIYTDLVNGWMIY